jgi:Tol biopolymer transport system component
MYIRTSSEKGFGSQLWVVNPDGTKPHAFIGAKNVVAADWSYDGTQVVVVRSDPATSTLQVWVGDADGKGFHMVGDPLPGTDATVDW